MQPFITRKTVTPAAGRAPGIPSASERGWILMAKNANDTCTKIIRAAWELFYENGYDDTTVDDIVARSGTSKGSSLS